LLYIHEFSKPSSSQPAAVADSSPCMPARVPVPRMATIIGLPIRHRCANISPA
jgi:hypothetical protein